jgi:N6-adenosine-specific RNA methylase IME4
VNLVIYDAACRALAEAKSIDEVKDFRDKAEAMRAYARQAKNKDLEADAKEIRMRATRRLDQLRQAQKETVGLNRGNAGGFADNPPDDRPTFASQGIDKNLAHQARTLGAMSDARFEAVVAGARDAVTSAVRKVVKGQEREQSNQETKRNARPIPKGKYAVIYADPPWRFDIWTGEGKDRAAENHYPTMTLEEIEALPVASLAADDCALFLWTCMPTLRKAFDVIEAWGFEYKTCAFVWVKRTKDGKPATGMGYWTRANAEICLLATRGSPHRLNADVHQVVMAPRREHSRKPDEVAARIERLVTGPYLELFARRPRDGWSVWGNQT